VGIWSEMEHFLKDVVRVCYRALEKRRRALEKTMQFCKDSLEREQPKETLDDCMKALKELQPGIPHAFDDIQKVLKRELGVELCKCSTYDTIDAIRILNNAFKHSRGRYEPAPDRSRAQINAGLLKRWEIIDDRKEIDYSNLPIEELVGACHEFCNELLGMIEAAIEKKVSKWTSPFLPGKRLTEEKGEE
jgi:hypothetical protein